MRFSTILAVTFLLLMVPECLAQDGWTNQTPSSTYPALMGVYAIDSDHIWAVGSEGTVIRSTNGGDTWDIVNTGFDDNFATVIFLNLDTGFVTGRATDDDPFVLRTYDAGSNWERIDLPASGNDVYDIDFFYSESEDSTIIFATGGLGYVWKTKKFGDSWKTLAGGCGNGNFNSCDMVDENTGWFVGTPDAQYNFSIMYTADGGLLFTEQTNPTERKLNGVSFANASKGIAVGLVGTILYTEDGGATWETRPNTGYRWQAVTQTETGKAWVVGDDGNIAHSEDYGYTWTNQESGLTYELWDVYFIDENEGWIVGGGIGNPGIVLHTTTGGETTTEIEPVGQAGIYSLDQNQPNPFRNKTRISYHVQNPGDITIWLYDASGNILECLVSEPKLQGDYQFEFVNDRYPAGIYFYDLKVGSELITTRKMIILE